MPPSVNDAYSALQGFTKTRKSATDFVKQANDQYNVAGLQGASSNLQSLVNNLQNSVAAVNPSVTGRTSGTFTTEGQRQALVSKEQAPILGSLGQQNQALGQAQTTEGNAESMANQMATSLLNSDQTKYQSLLDQYNAANAIDQFNKQQQASAAALAEQQRQFNAQLAENQRQFNLTPRGGGGGGNIVIGGGPQAKAAATGAQMVQKGGGDNGFAFTNAQGQPISAATYAQQANIPLGSLLQQMAQRGDTYAANAYNWMQSNQGMPYAKSNPNQVIKNAQGKFSALFWGT